MAPAAVEQAKSAFVTGLHVAAAVASLSHVALGVLALRFMPKATAAKVAA